MFIKVHLRIFSYVVNVGIYEIVKGKNLFYLNFLFHSRRVKMNKFKTITITKSESVRQEEQILIKDKDAEIVWKDDKKI